MGIRFKIILPLLLVMVSFIGVVHFYWTPKIIAQQEQSIINREHDVLHALAHSLLNPILSGNFSEIYSTLDDLIEHDSQGWKQLIVIDASNTQIYPLSEPVTFNDEFIKNVRYTLEWDKKPFVTLELWFDIRKDVAAIQANMFHLNSIILVTVVLITLGALLWQEKHLRKPLIQLNNVTKRMSEGDFNARLDYNDRNDEIGSLTSSFNTMRTNLQEAHYKLEKTVVRATESETRQRSIVENIMDAVITINEKGLIETFNPAAERIFGYSKDEMIGHPLGQLIPDNKREKHRSITNARLVSDDKNLYKHRIQGNALHKDGHVFPADISINEVRVNNRKIFTTIVRDITDEKEYESKLIQARDTAEKANNAKSEFLSRMSHELRTPMNAIMGFSQLIEMDAEQHNDESTQQHIQEIMRAGNHLLHLINEVLDLTRIETGNISLSMEPVNVRDILADCFQLMSPVAKDKGLTFSLDVDECNDIYVRADITRLKQIMLNLISNAIKYNKPEGNVTVTCEIVGDEIRFIIADTGQGINEEYLGEMFTPFNRLWAKNSTIEGTGIGLVIAKSFIEKMDGRISVESELGKGTVFWFTLKRTTGLKTPDNSGKIARFQDYSAQRLNRQKILYIEDNPANMRLVETLLKNEKDLQLLMAPEPRIGIDIAKTQLPELIMLDINLPYMDGYEVLRELRKITELDNTTVIAISANAMQRDIEKGIEAGFDEYLTKPIDVKQLLETIRKKLRKGRRQKDSPA